MNLFLSTLGTTPLGIFFSDDLTQITEAHFEKNDFFLDRLSQFAELAKVQKIFYIAGPSSFTALRNMSVFLNVFTEFSAKKIELFSLSTGAFFEINFPYSDLHILSVGRREGFVFRDYNPYSAAKPSYQKYKNPEISEMLYQNAEQHPDQIISGNFSDQFLEGLEEKFSSASRPKPSFTFPLDQEEFLQKILLDQKKFLTQTAIIDYGSEPNIG